MFSLQDLLGQSSGSQAVDQISQNLGADNSTVNSAIQLALPMILTGLAKNAQTPQGAQSLDNALAQDHNGGLLNNLTDFLMGGVPSPQAATRETNGAGILEHIFGGNQGQVAQEVSQKSGLDMAQVANLLITLAPIVMSFLGQKKQENNLDAGGISDLLINQQQQMQSSGNPMIDLASRILDRDGDGSALDDLASMAAGYFMK
ncbi:MAG: DUF937 domain-containing protein [Pyrinomonadaceae bacterium]